MGKLVVLKLGEGSFKQGFAVTLQIGDDEHHPCLETIGKLPPIPEISQYYTAWATNYRRLGLRSRLEASAAQMIGWLLNPFAQSEKNYSNSYPLVMKSV